MRFYRGDMRFQKSVSLVIVGSCHVSGVCRERYFRVDDYLSVVGVLNYHVRLHPLSAFVAYYFTVFIFQKTLSEVFLSLTQTGVFEYRFQNHLSPVSLHLRIAFQRTSQVVGVIANLFVELNQFFYAVFQREALLRLLVVHLCHLVLELLQVFVERL